MWKRDYSDISAGGFFLAVGLGAAGYAAAHYSLGSLRNIGPGMFPVGAGVALAGFGLAMLVPALARTGARPRFEPGVAAAVLASVAAFALVLPLFGLVPASVALVVVSRLAERHPRPVAMLVLAAILSLLVWAVFVVALGVPLAPVRWP
jgi:hypothetical protein